MPSNIFVNLPVRNLARSMAFFRALGYDFNPQFTDANAACLVIDERIYAMLLTEPFFAGFIETPVAQAGTATEVLIALSVDSADAVRLMVERALAAGAAPLKDLVDRGFMVEWGFRDPDGHAWQYLWMDPAHIQG